jgi:hypothetical protein
METFLSLLASPGTLLGTLAGIVAAGLFHWLAPAGTDTATAGAVIVAVCAGAGLGWELLQDRGSK